ncbi:dockerin type I repeat-containing protein [Ruminococcus sp. NK3A76]|uniref:dockerin type I repeat-containing protein n=1 Tax=Ruminococcus sp. NK3A76 TaxID=877411 RepID=UPI00048BC8C1|nr:dockerin type I repeat-containing protein [Ruminococcus sp. NK3A76]
MKKALSLLTALVLVIALGAFLPEGVLKAKALDEIKNLTVSYDGVLSFDRVEGAAYYRFILREENNMHDVYIEDIPDTGSSKQSFDLSDYATGGKEYTAKLTAYDNNRKALTGTQTKTFTLKRVTGVRILRSTTLHWNGYEGAKAYRINIDIGASAHTSFTVNDLIETDGAFSFYEELSDHMKGMRSGDYTISVTALGLSTGGTYTELASSRSVVLHYVNTTSSFPDRADITVTAPTVGAAPATAASIKLNCGGLASSSVRWCTYQDKGGSVTSFKGDKFLPGGKYAASIEMTLDENTFFDSTAEGKEGSATVNGVSATVTNSSGMQKLYVRFYFDQLPGRIPGDLNGDGNTDLKDGLLISQHLAGWKVAINESNADVNNDGKADLKDGLLLKQYLAGWKVTLR